VCVAYGPAQALKQLFAEMTAFQVAGTDPLAPGDGTVSGLIGGDDDLGHLSTPRLVLH
jgi:hypothetical protein